MQLVMLPLWLVLVGPAPDIEPAPRACMPHIGAMSPRDRSLVLQAVALATRRLAERQPCRALFEMLGAKGGAILSDTEFQLAGSRGLRHTCREHQAAALTVVHGRTVWLCPRFFVRMPRHRAAAMLIHEALHQSGLGEWPADPDGPTRGEIDRMVFAACGL